MSNMSLTETAKKLIDSRTEVSRAVKFCCASVGIAAGLHMGSAMENDTSYAPELITVTGAAFAAAAEHRLFVRKLDKTAREIAIYEGVVGMSAEGVRHVYTVGSGKSYKIKEDWLDMPRNGYLEGEAAAAKFILSASGAALFFGSIPTESTLGAGLDIFGTVVCAGFAIKHALDAGTCTRHKRDIAELHIEQIADKAATFQQG